MSRGVVMTNTIALDAMGGDFGPQVVVPAAISALNKHEDLRLILVGDQAKIEQQLSSTSNTNHQRIKIHHTTQVVEMNVTLVLAAHSSLQLE